MRKMYWALMLGGAVATYAWVAPGTDVRAAANRVRQQEVCGTCPSCERERCFTGGNEDCAITSCTKKYCSSCF